MGILRLLAVGVAGAVAYKAWQRRKAGTDAAAVSGEGDVNASHGDALSTETAPQAITEPGISSAQSSRGFGEES